MNEVIALNYSGSPPQANGHRRCHVSVLRNTARISNVNCWKLNGNVGTDPKASFLGTTDPQPLVIKTNSVERVRVLADEATVEIQAFGLGDTLQPATLRLSSSSVTEVPTRTGQLRQFTTVDSWDVSVHGKRLNFTTTGASDIFKSNTSALVQIKQKADGDYGPVLALVNNGRSQRTQPTTSAILFVVDSRDIAETDANAEIKAVNSPSFNSPNNETDLVFSAWGGTHLDEVLRIQGHSGNVGIGRKDPKARLDVQGDIGLGPDENKRMYASGGAEALRIVRGTIDHDGTQVAGTGYSCTKQIAPGKSWAAHVLVTFDPPFSDVPSATVTAIFNGDVWDLSDISLDHFGNTTTTANIVWINNSKMFVVTGNTDKSQRPWAFSFVAMGPR